MRTHVTSVLAAALAAGLTALTLAGAEPASPAGAAAWSPAGSPSAPGCTGAVARAPELTKVPTTMTRVPGAPFGIAVTQDGGSDLIALGPYLAVLRNARSGRTLVHRLRLSAGSSGRGVALTPDGRYLLVANLLSGADVISVRKAVHGAPHALAGTLSGGPPLKGAFEIAVSADGRFAFVTLASSAAVAVFDLHQALTSGFGPADFVGTVPVGFRPVGIAISPDGGWLYVTSEHAAPGVSHGTLSVISVPAAETDPDDAVVATVDAGCEPVRVVAAPDGRTVWVSARASDAVVGFSAAALATDPAHALLTWVRVGMAPIGLAMVAGGSRIVVADSDRFLVRGAAPSLAVIDVPAAIAGRPALLGYLRAGRIPREMAVVPGGRVLLVDNYGSGQVESVNLAALP